MFFILTEWSVLGASDKRAISAGTHGTQNTKRRKKVDFASFLPTKQQEKNKMQYRQRQKSHKLWAEIISLYSEVSLQI